MYHHVWEVSPKDLRIMFNTDPTPIVVLCIDSDVLFLIKGLCVVLYFQEVEGKVMLVIRERIPLAPTQPVTDTRSVCLSPCQSLSPPFPPSCQIFPLIYKNSS